MAQRKINIDGAGVRLVVLLFLFSATLLFAELWTASQVESLCVRRSAPKHNKKYGGEPVRKPGRRRVPSSGGTFSARRASTSAPARSLGSLVAYVGRKARPIAAGMRKMIGGVLVLVNAFSVVSPVVNSRICKLSNLRLTKCSGPQNQDVANGGCRIAVPTCDTLGSDRR